MKHKSKLASQIWEVVLGEDLQKFPGLYPVNSECQVDEDDLFTRQPAPLRETLMVVYGLGVWERMTILFGS